MSEENLTRTGALHSKHTLTELRGLTLFPLSSCMRSAAAKTRYAT